MKPSSRTPEGQPNHCPVCGKDLKIEPSRPPGDAPCPHCGHLLWFQAGRTAEEIQQRINREPKELTNYFELAQLHLNNEDYKAAEEVYSKAYDISDDDEEVRWMREDVELRSLRQEIVLAEKDGDSELRDELMNQLKAKELAVIKKRAELYPSNLLFKYDLGLRYQMNSQYNEAINEFQQAQNDPRRRGACMLALGQCFEEIRKNGLALLYYKSAIEEIPDRDVENKKQALYLTAQLYINLKDHEAAEECLDRLAQLREGF